MTNANMYVSVLQYNGEAGVDLAIKILLDEFRRTMMLTGYVEALIGHTTFYRTN